VIGGADPAVVVPAVIIPVVVVAVGLTVLLLWLRKRRRLQRVDDGTEMANKDKNVTVNVMNSISSIDEKLRIPSKTLELKNELGAGSFGKVFLGEWQGAKVAIKVCASVANVDGFFEEAALTVGLPPHPNVVQTFGISVDGPLPYIVLEFCGGGSLDKKLFDEGVEFKLAEKLRMIKGIARGLLHLHNHNIIHRDLAARNILLTSNNEPKISDFGMSRLLKEESQKGQTKNNFGPIRWMAPESIRDLSYSTKSDVWSFGVIMYEIVSGMEPHSEITDIIDIAMKIKTENLHPTLPANIDQNLASIMLSCWRPVAVERPSMTDVVQRLNNTFSNDD
jgi:serine/threonine protein kinase